MGDNSVQIRFLAAINSLNLKFPVAEISEKTGVGQSTVSTYLNSRRPVSDNFLKRFCEVFNLDYQGIRYGADEIQADNKKSPDQSEDFRAKYIKQLEKENDFLQEMMKTNLTLVLATVRTISARQIGAGKTVLKSLERLEVSAGLQPGSLVKEADKEIDQIEREAYAHDSRAVQST